jgi:hypothetical protein
MTEQEWLSCTDRFVMLNFLRGNPSDRKLRLFAVACCHRIWHLLPNAAARNLLEIAERYADGDASDEELHDAEGRLSFAEWNHKPGCGGVVYHYATEAVGQAARDRRQLESAWEAAAGASDQACHTVGAFSAWTSGRMAAEIAMQCGLLRDIFGNPFRPQTTVNSSWFSWNCGIVPKLAQAIYDDRAFDRLPILADALEEAGCDNADILNHCRQPGEHVRGCWVVDLLLNKS